jgi:ATP-binding cassette subfamily F protein 3
VLHVHAGRLTPYAGGYDYYLDKSRATSERGALTADLRRNGDDRGGAAPAARTGVHLGNASPSRTPAASAPPAAPVRTGPKTKEQKRAEAAARAARSEPLRAARARVTSLEKEIASLEQLQAELTAALEAPATYEEPGKAQALNRSLATTVDRLQSATHEWEAASVTAARLEQSG